MSINNRVDFPGRPTVSVCVPMYDNAATIARCLESILSQEGIDFEIVVVDDDSSDDCAAIARQMLRPRDRLIRNSPRLGLNGNHNRCLELARGTCVQFVHGDDWLLPGALRTLATYFEDSAVGLAFAPRMIASDDPTWTKWNEQLHTGFRRLAEYNSGPDLVAQIASRGVHRNWIGEPTCVMFRRLLAVDAGRCRSDIHQLVDLDLWLRLMLRSSVCFHPHELSVHSHTANTASARIVGARRNWLDRLRILTWLTVDPAAPESVRMRARLWWKLIRLRSMLECGVFGPSRWSRVKYLRNAVALESEAARQFIVEELQAPTVAASMRRSSPRIGAAEVARSSRAERMANSS